MTVEKKGFLVVQYIIKMCACVCVCVYVYARVCVIACLCVYMRGVRNSARDFSTRLH